MDHNRLLCWKPSHRFKDFAFLLAGAIFICILGSEVLVFVNGIFVLFKPPGKLHGTGQASLWAPLDVGSSGSLHDELHDSDDSVLQLICGFIQVCASVMCGGVHVCLAI